MTDKGGKRAASTSSSEEKTGEVEDKVKVNVKQQPFELDIRITRSRARERRMEFPKARDASLPSGIRWKGRAPSSHFTRSLARHEGRVLDEVKNMSLPLSRRPPTKKARSQNAKPTGTSSDSSRAADLGTSSDSSRAADLGTSSDSSRAADLGTSSDSSRAADLGTSSDSSRAAGGSDIQSANGQSRFEEPSHPFTLLHSQETDNVAASSTDIVCFADVSMTESLKNTLKELGFEVFFKRCANDRAVGICWRTSIFECTKSYTFNVSFELRKVVKGLRDVDRYIIPDRFATIVVLKHHESGHLLKVATSQSAARTETLQMLEDSAVLEHLMKLSDPKLPVIFCGHLDPANSTPPTSLFVQNILYRSVFEEKQQVQGTQDVDKSLYTFYGQGIRLVSAEHRDRENMMAYETVPKTPRSTEAQRNDNGPDDVTTNEEDVDDPEWPEEHQRDLTLVEELTETNLSMIYDSVSLILFTDGDEYMIALAKKLLQDAAETYTAAQATYVGVGGRSPLPDIRFLYEGQQIINVVGAHRRRYNLDGPKVMLAIVDESERISYRLKDSSITKNNIKILLEKYLNMSHDYLPVCF